MARTAGSNPSRRPQGTKPKTTVDPLLAALIARLPPSNTPWPIAGRAAWLEMMERAFDVVYGAADRQAMNAAEMQEKFNRLDRGAPIAPAEPDYAFYIDREGFARIAGGERINATEVDGVLHDMRGEGDLGAITWADGTKGVLGKVLDIKPA